MTDSKSLLALVERVEALTGPCRETDAEVHAFYGYGDKSRVWYHSAPAYTDSLDAAITLVPDRWRMRQMHFNAPCVDDRKWHLNLRGGRVGQNCAVGRGATPALALTAAALRTLAAKEPAQ